MARKTPYPDISTQPHHLPFITATRMLFPQANYIAKLYFHIS
jgi:hypothetical protein